MDDLYELIDYSEMLKNKKRLKEKFLQNPACIEKRIAVLCGSTFGEIKEFIEIFLLYHGIKPIFWEGNYNRFYEEACFSNKELSDFSPEFILLHMTSKNLLYHEEPSLDYERLLQKEKQRLSHIWESLAETYQCDIIQNNFEYFPYRIIGNAAKVDKGGNVRYIDNINDFVTVYAEHHKYFRVNDIHYLSSYIGLVNWYDDRMWNLYKCPMAMEAMPRYALSIANIIKSVLGRNKKAIITDLDNTLWGGTIGEVGVEGIKLGMETPQGESFDRFHKYLKKLSQQGILLNICSKNDYETGIRGLESSKSVLRKDDFLMKKINWNPKADNIKEILDELNILSDSAIFIDDNPVECDSVKSMLPGMETIQVNTIDHLIEQLDIVSYFEVTGISQEDSKRGQLYKEEIVRSQEKQKYQTYEEYLNSLGMVCKIEPVNEKNILRAVQLLNKTNQFNFMTNRYTQEDLCKLCGDEKTASFVLSLRDRFGDSGIVAIAIVRIEDGEAHINDWVMSCRVFERGLEYEMLKQICQVCLLRNIKVLYGYYRQTEKNKKIAGFYENLSFERDCKNDCWVCKSLKDLFDYVVQKTTHLRKE